MMAPVVINPNGTLTRVPLADALRRLTEPRSEPPRRVRTKRAPAPPRWTVITETMAAAMVDARREGATMTDLAERFGVCDYHIRAVLAPHGLAGDQRRRRAERFVEEIRVRLAGGERVRTIAADLGLAEFTVDRVRRANRGLAGRTWSPEEIAAVGGAPTRQAAMRQYRAAFPDSDRSDEAVRNRVYELFPDLPLGRVLLTADEVKRRKEARHTAWRKAHPERLHAMAQRYYAGHREEIRARQLAYRSANRERMRAYDRAYRARKREAEA